MISAKGREGINTSQYTCPKNKDEEKHACNTFYGQYVQPIG